MLLFVYVDLTRGDRPLSVCYALLWHNFNAEILAVGFPPLLRKLMEGHFGYVDGGFQGTDSPELSPVSGLAQYVSNVQQLQAIFQFGVSSFLFQLVDRE